MMPLLYYIRHGETDWNTQARLQGQRDIPINANGQAQARVCGGILRDCSRVKKARSISSRARSAAPAKPWRSRAPRSGSIRRRIGLTTG
jgi:broad specificity phosphatase PhoE